MARAFVDLVHPDDRAATLRELGTLADGVASLSFICRFEAKSGSYRWLDWHATVPPDEPLLYASARDVTERVRIETALREAEQRFRTAFDGAPIGVCLVALDAARPAVLQQANPALAEMLGACADDLAGVTVAALTHPDDRLAVEVALRSLTDGRCAHVVLEKRLMHRDGHPVWALLSAARPPGPAGDHTPAVTHVLDISDRKHTEGQLQHLADHDALTGLVNRRRFTEELERVLAQSHRPDESGAVLFLDLDGFKFVNDTLGHAAGSRARSASRCSAATIGSTRTSSSSRPTSRCRRPRTPARIATSSTTRSAGGATRSACTTAGRLVSSARSATAALRCTRSRSPRSAPAGAPRSSCSCACLTTSATSSCPARSSTTPSAWGSSPGSTAGCSGARSATSTRVTRPAAT